LNKFYKETKLLGNLPETKIFGIKPLKLFHASRVKLVDRYGLAYQYIMSQNLDQKVDEKFTVLSNFNDMAISSFETGSFSIILLIKWDTIISKSFKRFYCKNSHKKLILRFFKRACRKR
jgi:hypothetical protein